MDECIEKCFKDMECKRVCKELINDDSSRSNSILAEIGEIDEEIEYTYMSIFIAFILVLIVGLGLFIRS